MKSVAILANSMEIINHSILLDILHVNLVWSILKNNNITFSIPKFLWNIDFNI